MDNMDIDQIVVVPDTPDRIAAQNISGRDGTREERRLSMTNHSETSAFLEEGSRNWPSDKNKLTDSGSKRLLFRPQHNVCNYGNRECHRNISVATSRNEASFKNINPIKRMASDKTLNHKDKYYIRHQPMGDGKVLSSSQPQMSAHQGHSVTVDLTEQNGHAKVYQNAIPGYSQTEEFRKGSRSANCFSSLHIAENSPSVYNNACKGKEKLVDDTNKVGGSFDCGKGVTDFLPDSKKTMPTSHHPITSHRFTGQKRLVLNGCISPYNVAKAKQAAQKHSNFSVHSERGGPGTKPPDGRPSLPDIRELIAEAKDSRKLKGKGVITSFSSTGPDAESKPPSRRSSILNRNADGTSGANGDAFGCSEGLGGWRSTRNRTRKMNAPLSDEERLLASRKDDSCLVDGQGMNEVVRRDYGSGINPKNANYNPEDQLSVFCKDVPAPPVVQTASHFKHEVGQSNEHQYDSHRHTKRQKQGLGSSNRGKCSSSAFDDSEIVFLGSSGESSNVRPARMLNNHYAHNSDSVIEIDEFSPEIRKSGTDNIGCSSNVDSDVRARQLEADEMLARELQEQLYNEVPGVRVPEIDEHIALALQQEESSQHAIASGSHLTPSVHPRRSSVSNLRRQTLPRSSQSTSIRRGTQARVPTSTRMSRLRAHFPGQSRTISSRQRNSIFPPNVDVDMRIHILEALETISEMGSVGGLLQVQRDFNENDYEMLLSLDENNHQHGGASLAQINGLPQSTVQSENLEECSICLETPSIGDTVRHLPCLHRFHKDCIDPWLRRKTSCPVCKSSIS